MVYYNKPILGWIGIGLFSMTVVVHLCFKLSRTTDVGIGILLSGANALCMLYTLLWIVLGILELRIFLRMKEELEERKHDKTISTEKYLLTSKNLKYCFIINGLYLLLFVLQLGYVIYSWDELNI
ncbi:hypothetical protein [Paenibacillus sp. WLX2291]|uniref:hypothetical protein n=1 Tax=Paenibacillus sp. WLX2291 TaxID=3296934 RepID=UPI003983F9DE